MALLTGRSSGGPVARKAHAIRSTNGRLAEQEHVIMSAALDADADARGAEEPQLSDKVNDGRADTPVADLEACVAGLVNAVDKGLAKEVEPYGLMPLEFNLLRICLEKGECTATQLAELLPVDASRISRIVTRLVDKGLLQRRRLREDRRVVWLRLSEEGNELTSKIGHHVRRYDAKLTAGISDDDLGVFASVTCKILGNYAAMQEAE